MPAILDWRIYDRETPGALSAALQPSKAGCGENHVPQRTEPEKAAATTTHARDPATSALRESALGLGDLGFPLSRTHSRDGRTKPRPRT